MAELRRYILLPRKGWNHESLRELNPEKGHGLAQDFRKSQGPVLLKSKLAGGRDILVHRSIMADGPKVVDLDDIAAGEINRHPDVHILPVKKYKRPLSRSIMRASYPLIAPDPVERSTGKSAQGVTIRVTEEKKGGTEAVGSGLVVTAFSNFQEKIGDNKVTDNEGEVILKVSGETIQRLFCEKMWTWGAFRQDVPVEPIINLQLEKLSEKFKDSVRTYYSAKRFDITTGVTVGVIDTGVGPHDDLNVIGGYNSVEGEPTNDYLDVGPHGTFVAGLIGSKGKLFPMLHGLAPGVNIRAYRVFGGGLAGGETDALIDAMYRAELDGCDILNLSIESPEEGRDLKDEGLQEAITRARENGMLVVVAAGNDGKDVDYPAAFDGATAVSAMGCKGTFPERAMENIVIGNVTSPTNPNEFIASFSNHGKQISVTALGVGVLSTLPGNSFGSCSGTSFAAPVVTGAAASLLSQNREIYNMPRNRDRSNAIEQLLLSNCILRRFGPEYEGHGMPNPAVV